MLAILLQNETKYHNLFNVREIDRIVTKNINNNIMHITCKTYLPYYNEANPLRQIIVYNIDVLHSHIGRSNMSHLIRFVSDIDL